MKALSNSHPFRLVIDEERETRYQELNITQMPGERCGQKEGMEIYRRKIYMKRKNS